MTVGEIIAIAVCIVTLICVIAAIIILNKNKATDSSRELAEEIRKELYSQNSALRQELNAQTQSAVNNMGEQLNRGQESFSRSQTEKLGQLEERFKTFSLENEQKLDQIRVTMERKLTYLQEDNNRKLDEMRKTVDDKLQSTLENKINQSFSLVNERLEQVYKGLGEMQGLAAGVGDLKKVLSNVKTRGILGEIQLGSILSEILTSNQYDENVVTKKGTRNPVEFAIKLPADDDRFIYLPIDSKFPGDTYATLRDAIDSGDRAAAEAAAKQLTATLKSEAKDIRDKYIDPPNTTDFAIMFLPFEGLYSEVVNRGLVEILQREYKVNVAGPSTMAALLNSLQMGFKTLTVQKRSAEVWELLREVKNEFDKYVDAIETAQKHIEQVGKDLETVAGVRSRVMKRKLEKIQLPDAITDGKD